MRGVVGVVGFTLFAGLSSRNSLPDMDSFLLCFICGASLVPGVVLFCCGRGEGSLPAAEVRALIWERARLLKLAM